MSRKILGVPLLALQSGVALSALALSAAAFAQVPQPVGDAANSQTSPSSDPAENASVPGQADPAVGEETVLVTGTQIRGIDPVGSPVISLDRGDIAATGATTANQLLSSIPQVSGFNSLTIIGNGGASAQLPVVRPRLRNIGNEDAGAPATLILVDGHRVVGAGIRQTSADPDIVPPGAIDRVEVIPDGGSSIYGADAVAGVINLITRRRFSGVQVDAKAGFGDDYYQVDAYATVGHQWGSGGAYISYNYSKQDEILGIDRDFFQRYDYVNDRQADLGCSPGNISFGGKNYALPGRVTDPNNNGNRCDYSDFSTFFPDIERHSVFGSVSQDIGESIKLDLRGFYTRRTSTYNSGFFRSENANVTNTNPYFDPIGTETRHAVSFNWEPIFGNASGEQKTSLDAWGLTPSVTVDVDDNWQFRGMFNYGRSNTEVLSAALNPTLLAAALRGANPSDPTQTGIQFAINPYDLAATQNKALFADIANWQGFSQNKQRIINARGIVDGKLFTWDAGDVRLAAGVEYLKESVAPRQGSTVIGAQDTIPVRVRASREVKAAFGELFIPIIGNDNLGAFHSLSLSLSGRYDDYSDVGHTFNPRVAATFEPVEWLKIRGAWGTSFTAPSLADTIGSPDGGISRLAQAFVPLLSNPDIPMNPALGDNQAIINYTGAFPGVKPQEAETFSVGFDVRPPFIPGFTGSLTYFKVDYKGQIALPPVFLGKGFYGQFTNLFIMYPTKEQVLEAAALYPNGVEDITELYNDPSFVTYILIDARRRNLGRLKLDGLDFSANYTRQTGFGALDFGFAGTYELNREDQAFEGQPFVDRLERDMSRFRFTATAGATVGKFRSQLTWRHSQGYDITEQAAFDFQDHVSSYDVFDLFMQYNVDGEGLFQDLSVNMNINNIFDTDPPLLRGFSLVSQGYANGSTLGRIVQFGVSKKF